MIPFQLGVITDEISGDFERALDVMLEYDIRQVELRELWGKNILQHSAEDLARARAAIQSRDMRVCSIASPFYKCPLRGGAGPEAGEKKMHGAAEVGRSQQMEILRKAFETAHYFGAGIVRVFAFWRNEPLTPEVLSLIREAFVEPLRLAEQEALILGLENEHACLLGTGAETGPFIREVGSPHLRCVWDPGNAFMLDERSFPDGYAAVKDVMGHVHIKDARRAVAVDGSVKHSWTVVGQGEIDYPGQFRALIEDDFRGVVSLETHYRDSQGDAEASSRACLEGIRTILNTLS